jgi:hypothetical protein
MFERYIHAAVGHDLLTKFVENNTNLGRACNRVQGATASLAFPATAGLWNL